MVYPAEIKSRREAVERDNTTANEGGFIMNLTEKRFKVTGRFPLLTHNPAGMQQASKSAKTKKIDTPEDEARKGLYIDGDGNYCLPSIGFRNALLTGLKGKKIGKVGAATVIQPAVFNADELTVIRDPETWEPLKDYTVDSRRAMVQRQGIVRNRPRFNQWGCIVTFLIDEDVVSVEQVAEHLNEAGTTTGVGDFRIEKRGQFGSFVAEVMEEGAV